MWYKVEVKVNVNIAKEDNIKARIQKIICLVQECEIREMHLANLQDGSNFTN